MFPTFADNKCGVISWLFLVSHCQLHGASLNSAMLHLHPFAFKYCYILYTGMFLAPSSSIIAILMFLDDGCQTSCCSVNVCVSMYWSVC
jgi:hypothetical protein